MFIYYYIYIYICISGFIIPRYSITSTEASGHYTFPRSEVPWCLEVSRGVLLICWNCLGLLMHRCSKCSLTWLAGWWFGTCFIFYNIWDNPSHWLIFFGGVETCWNHQPAWLDCFFWWTEVLMVNGGSSERNSGKSIFPIIYIYYIYNNIWTSWSYE